MRCEISEGEVRFFSSPFFFFFEFSRDLNRQWKSRKTLVVGFAWVRVFYEKRYIYKRIGGIHYNSLDRRKTKGTTFPNGKLRDWSEGGR